MANDDGGPLFVRDGDKEICRLTVRDAFAIQVAGHIWQAEMRAHTERDKAPDEDCHADYPCWSETATYAYRLADAMLAERTKPKDQT